MKDREKAHSEGRRQVGTGDRASHDVCNPDCCPLGPFLQALRPMHPSGGHQTNGMVGQTRDDLQVQNRPVGFLQVPHLKQSDDLPWTPPRGAGWRKHGLARTRLPMKSIDPRGVHDCCAHCFDYRENISRSTANTEWEVLSSIRPTRFVRR